MKKLGGDPFFQFHSPNLLLQILQPTVQDDASVSIFYQSELYPFGRFCMPIPDAVCFYRHSSSAGLNFKFRNMTVTKKKKKMGHAIYADLPNTINQRRINYAVL
ncbi:MAG: hypothetical protein GY874_24235 [Desulfobacteraceae bacterium]|nr:hypothetical protein [Desulfobacteraceae bacterium]